MVDDIRAVWLRPVTGGRETQNDTTKNSGYWFPHVLCQLLTARAG